MTTDLDRLGTLTAEYVETYFSKDRDRASITCSDVYNIEEGFKERVSYPNAASAGVYAIFDPDQRLLYVGKSGNIGKRMSAYFKYENFGEGTLQLRDPEENWHGRPTYLVTVPVNQFWEASSLEEFLIHKLQPPVNINGRG